MRLNTINDKNINFKPTDLKFSYLQRALSSEIVKETKPNFKSSVNISDNGTLRNQYYQLLQSSASTNKVSNLEDSNQSDSINSISVGELIYNYGESYEDISKNMSGDEKKLNLEALDAAFNDIAKQKAEMAASSFDNIFDYASNNLSKYGMDDVKGIFDISAFKDNFSNLIIRAKHNYIKNLETMGTTDALNAALTSSGNTTNLNSLENIDLAKADNISKLINTGFSTSGETIDVMLNWSKSYNDIIQSLYLTDDLKDKMITAKDENIKAFAKIRIFTEETENNKKSLEELEKRLNDLNKILASMDEDASKTTDMNKKLRLLRREAGIKKQVNKLTKDKDNLQRKQNLLNLDPDSIEGNDKYKVLMDKYSLLTKSNVK